MKNITAPQSPETDSNHVCDDPCCTELRQQLAALHTDLHEAARVLREFEQLLDQAAASPAAAMGALRRRRKGNRT